MKDSKLQGRGKGCGGEGRKSGRPAVGGPACLTALLAAGCLTLPSPDPADTARAPESLGIRLEARGAALHAEPVNVVVRREPATLAFCLRPFGEAVPIVRVRVNGHTVLALVDTGSTATLMDSTGAARVGVPALRSAAPADGGLLRLPSQGLGARFNAWLGIAPEVRAGGVTVTNLVVGILDPKTDLGARGWMAGHRVEMLLGSDFLRLCGRVVWDVSGDRIALAPPESIMPGGGAVLDPAHVVPVCRARVGADREVSAGIDSGGAFGFWVPGPLFRGAKLPQPGPEGRIVLSEGMGGRVVSTTAGAVDLRVGDSRLEGVPMLMGATGHGHAHLPYALLGRAALAGRIVSFDFDRGTVHVSP